MRAIPHDIWLHIAQYIPPLVLQDLIAVNRSFYEIAMDARYRQIMFAYLDNRMCRTLVRLRDPEVARRVRILHVYPGFLKEALDKDSSTLSRRSLRYRLTDIANQIREQRLLFTKCPKYRLFRSLRTAEDVARAMLEVLGSLPNVTDYYISWFDVPTLSPSAVPFIGSVLHNNLRKLSLDISFENARSLLASTYQMRNLEELQLSLHCEHPTSLVQREEVMINHIAPAIGRLKSTLHTLVIQPWEPVDLSPLFRAIPHISTLETLCIAIPVGAPHLGDPTGLTDLLNRHATKIRCLQLRATQYGGSGMTPDPVSFYAWVKSAFHYAKLPKLRSLQVSSSLFSVDTSLIPLTHFSRSITSLSLTGTYWTYDDVVQALQIFSGRSQGESLGKLRLGTVALSPQLVDLLAEKLPGLYKLELIVKTIIPHADDRRLRHGSFHGGHKSSVSSSQFARQIDKFVSAMERRIYVRWQLACLSVSVDILPCRSHYGPLLEQLFVQSIPSIRIYSCR